MLKYFATKLDHCMKFRMFFPAAPIDSPNSKVCLIGEWSINRKFFFVILHQSLDYSAKLNEICIYLYNFLQFSSLYKSIG